MQFDPNAVYGEFLSVNDPAAGAVVAAQRAGEVLPVGSEYLLATRKNYVGWTIAWRYPRDTNIVPKQWDVKRMTVGA